MTLTEWFDPNNKKHLKAYQYLMETGELPDDFVPEDIEWDMMWQVKVLQKMADCWIKYKLG